MSVPFGAVLLLTALLLTALLLTALPSYCLLPYCLLSYCLTAYCLTAYSLTAYCLTAYCFTAYSLTAYCLLPYCLLPTTCRLTALLNRTQQLHVTSRDLCACPRRDSLRNLWKASVAAQLHRPFCERNCLVLFSGRSCEQSFCCGLLLTSLTPRSRVLL